MANDDENFDLSMNMEEPIYSFKVVHLYNKSNTYHLTRQVLLDSTLTQDTYCFFYHILSKNSDEFNQIYGSFACLFARSEYEADLYLNVEMDALEHIIRYIQTGKINGEKIYSQNWKLIDEIIDLATMFGMPNLVSMLRNLHPSDEKINNKLQEIKNTCHIFIQLYQSLIDPDKKWYKIEEYLDLFDNFFENNKQTIIDKFIKINIYGDPFFGDAMLVYVSIFLGPIYQKWLLQTHHIHNG